MSDFKKPFIKMTDDEKLAYSRFIQGKYIKDFNDYLKALNNGKISLQKVQIKEWVEALRRFMPGTIEAGWKEFIQTLRPNYLPSILEAREHFKKYVVPYKEPVEDNDDYMSDKDFRRMMRLCMDYRKDGAALFHQKCITFWKELAGKETDPTIKSEHLESVSKHKQMLRDVRVSAKKSDNDKIRGDRCPI